MFNLLRWCILCLSLTVAATAATITKVPFTITKPGTYNLAKSFTYTGTGNAITVEADDVIIDLRGFTLTGNPEVLSANTTAAIFANARQNITVRNGTIRSFFRGVFLEGSNSTGGHLVESLRVQNCRFLGIQTKGRYTIVRNNQVLNTGGSTSLANDRYGIHVQGSNVRILNNDVQEIIPTGSGPLTVGIWMIASPASVVEGNRVSQITNNSFSSSGIFLKESAGTIVSQNTCISFYNGISFAASDTAEYTDNKVSLCNVDYSGAAVDRGNNR